jgi:peptidoglycan hydrolase-like protein with peptidoglycan-binding domain
MTPIRSLLAVPALAVASVITFLPASASASTTASTPICSGTGQFSSSLPPGEPVIVPTASNNPLCVLAPNNSSGLVAVKRLQIDLNDCYGFHLTVDGAYGPLTAAAVKSVQANEDVTQDGDYGPQTIQGTGGDAFDYQVTGKSVGTCAKLLE